jgi:G3E family GTPase
MELFPQTPVTLLTGFLGAGKTTALNHLLRDPDAGRIAVIMNEFGEAGLDHDLIEEATEETVLMQSGCLCCSIRGDLAKTMISLLARRYRKELHFDRIVIETTGLADPGPILQTLLVERELAQHFRMDGVVTIADAAVGPQTLDAQFEAVSQIAMADLVVISKADLVTPTALAAFRRRISGINAHARQVIAERGRVAPGLLFGLSAMRPGVGREATFDWVSSAPLPLDPLANLSGLVPVAAVSVLPGQHNSPHDARIGSASVTIDEPISASLFDYWLDRLIGLKGPDILRMRGIVHVEGLPTPFVFHGVQHIFDPPVPLKSWPSDDRRSRIVVIARDISASALQASLDVLRTGTIPEMERA